MNDSIAALHPRFGRETFATFAGNFEVWVFRVVHIVCHTSLQVKVAVEHRRDEINDGQGAKRDCSTTELRPDMVGATGFEPMTDNPCLRPIKNCERARNDLDSTIALPIELFAPKREGGLEPPTYSVR